MSTYSLSAGSINLILHLAQQKGADKETLCQLAEIDPKVLHDPDARIAIRHVQALWKAAVELTGNAQLPLQLGEAVNLFSLGVLAYLLMHCPTLAEVMQKLVQYQDIACAGVRTSVTVEGETCFLKLTIMDKAIVCPSYAVESELSVYAQIFGQLVGASLPIQEVHFPYPAFQPLDEYCRIFGTPNIFFASCFTGITFPASVLQMPVLNANASLFSLFEKHAHDYLQKLNGSDTLGYKVRQEITQALKGEEPKLGTIARNLAMSERSMQMKLKEEGFTYQHLLDEVRKEMAISHLKEPYMSTTDIAYLLGFSELSVFSRAFKKWTGTTPHTYRNAG
jgi:AraC-like DNA-binding protein